MLKLDLILLLSFVTMITSFAAGAEPPRPEHPRPDLIRDAWQNLNGEWFFQEDPEDRGEADEWFSRERIGIEKGEKSGKIIVPFEIESRLSGIARENPSEVFWYLKRFELSEELNGRRVILHFGAVDYHAKVWLNGDYLGEHKGGYTAFCFDVTSNLKPGENRLAVRVFDSKSVQQVRGKQTWKDQGWGIMYTAVSGIWQTVWLEAVGPVYIIRYEIWPELNKGQVRVRVFTDRPEQGNFLSVTIKDPQGALIKCPDKVGLESTVTELIWRVENPQLWSPDEPNLYDLEFQITDSQGKVIDRVAGYAGLRTIDVRDGEVLLNGKPIYQKLLLVQGYYPPGVYSPASDEAFRKDVEAAKLMGFNGARIHQKIEDPRYYYWCDRLGFLIWEEMPGFMFWKINQIPKRSSRAQFQNEMSEMIQRDFNHPSVIVWTIFNETWGLMDAVWNPVARRWWLECVRLCKDIDPTRLIVDNSGWLHRKTDILDVHHYIPTVEKSEEFYKTLEKPSWGILRNIPNIARGVLTMPPLFWGTKYKGQPIIISEYGGFGFYKTEDRSLLDNYRSYTQAIGQYPYIKGYCYTQQYDVEQEQNGLQTQDRKFKLPPEDIKKINDSIKR